MIETLAQITGTDTYGRAFCAGIVLWDDVVVEVAPILKRRLKGLTRDEVRQWAHDMNYAVEVVHELTRSRAGPTRRAGGRRGLPSAA